jgi:hypothetical protein
VLIFTYTLLFAEMCSSLPIPHLYESDPLLSIVYLQVPQASRAGFVEQEIGIV